MNQDGIEELIMKHENDLTMEELQELLDEEHQKTQDVFSSEKEKNERGPAPTSAIKNLLKKLAENVRRTILELQRQC